MCVCVTPWAKHPLPYYCKPLYSCVANLNLVYACKPISPQACQIVARPSHSAAFSSFRIEIGQIVGNGPLAMLPLV